MNEVKLNTAFNYAFADGTFTQSAIVIKDGKLVHERYRGILEGEINSIASSTTLDAATLQFLLAIAYLSLGAEKKPHVAHLVWIYFRLNHKFQ